MYELGKKPGPSAPSLVGTRDYSPQAKKVGDKTRRWVKGPKAALVLFVAIISGTLAFGQEVELVMPIVVNGLASQDLKFGTWLEILAREYPSIAEYQGFTDQGEPMNVGDTSGFSPHIYLNFGSISDPGRSSFKVGHTPSPPDSGWVLATIYGSQSFKLYSTVVLSNQMEVLSITSIPAVIPSKDFIVPVIKPTTAYAIVNPSESETAHVILDARRPDEEEGCQTTLAIAPRHRVSKFFHELFGTACEHGGIVRIEGDIPIAVGALKVYMPEFRFNGLAVE